MCPDLPQPQRENVEAAAEQALVAAAEETLTANPRPNNNAGSQLPIPQAIIRDALSKGLRTALPADQWERFAAEAEARIKRRREAVILMVIEHLDNVLYLSLDSAIRSAARSLNIGRIAGTAGCNCDIRKTSFPTCRRRL